ncbi:MAG: glycoside hydrolase family 125 protein [Melioribacteraceae bacterium]
MSSRRDFIKKGGLALAGITITKDIAASKATISSNPFLSSSNFISKRPKQSERKFISDSVEAKIAEVKNDIADPELAWLFENCYPNTLDTTVTHKLINGKPDTFVITGDINAMWLRDSTAQVWPYLPLTHDDKKLRDLIAGVINRQTKCILIDPYANAFNDGPTGSYWDSDETEMKPELHERKWEIDSLCYPVRLAYGYWKTTGDTSLFDDDWKRATKLIYKTFIEQQRKENLGPYKFGRKTSWQLDTLAGGGYGNPVKPVGLICSMFRPSDDATTFSFLVPSNFFAVKTLRQLTELFGEVVQNKNTAFDFMMLGDEIEEALQKYALAEHLDFGKMFPYEVDGFGNKLFMDDANVPSLLSLPYLDAVDMNDEIYRNTRKFLFSENNPYFFKGKAGEGIGGPHAGFGKIWNLSIIMRGLTSNNETEILSCIKTLKSIHANTGFMHESFDKDDASKFSRSWFAWANTLFGEFIIKVHSETPQLLKTKF